MGWTSHEYHQHVVNIISMLWMSFKPVVGACRYEIPLVIWSGPPPAGRLQSHSLLDCCFLSRWREKYSLCSSPDPPTPCDTFLGPNLIFFCLVTISLVLIMIPSQVHNVWGECQTARSRIHAVTLGFCKLLLGILCCDPWPSNLSEGTSNCSRSLRPCKYSHHI